jgi:hypothetical protein
MAWLSSQIAKKRCATPPPLAGRFKNSGPAIGFHGSSGKATGSPHSRGHLGVLATQPGASWEPSDKSLSFKRAASALAYAQRAEELDESSVEARAQFAWALGSSTHLQPMTTSSDHARQTIEVAEQVLERDPAEPTGPSHPRCVQPAPGEPALDRARHGAQPSGLKPRAGHRLGEACGGCSPQQGEPHHPGQVLARRRSGGSGRDRVEAARTASSTYPRDTASMPALEQ